MYVKKRNKRLRIVALSITIIPELVGIAQYNKSLPNGVSVESKSYKIGDIQFIFDLAYHEQGKQILEQHLMDEALKIIKDAEEFIVIDMFLYNDDYDRAKGAYPKSAEQITAALLEKRANNPHMPITVISDEINTLYGSNDQPFFKQLEAQNIDVILTNLKPLRDSNPIYSSIWRSYLQWWKPSQNGLLPNAFNPDGGKGSVGSYLDLVNFKANHRKIVMNESHALLTSANLAHDGSSYHSNIGFIVKGQILKEIYASEQAVAKLSGLALADVTFKEDKNAGELEIQLLTEGKIKVQMLEMLQAADEGSTIKIGVFYISDRDIVNAIKDAAERGATIQLILDPNKDAFGIEKNGIPNRQVAAELMRKKNIEVRWYNTHGEQYHSKFLLLEKQKEVMLIGGSANFTRRNLADYNLESSLYVKIPADHKLAAEVNDYFNRLWLNEEGSFTVPFEKYEDRSIWKTAVYRFQEWTGLSTF